MAKQSNKQTTNDKLSLKKEMAEADQALRKKVKRSLKRKYPLMPDNELQEIIDDIVPLFIKAIYKANTRAFVKLSNMAFGKLK